MGYYAAGFVAAESSPAIPNPQSPIRNPQSTIRNLEIHNPQLENPRSEK
jgi:hypothetical protein